MNIRHPDGDLGYGGVVAKAMTISRKSSSCYTLGGHGWATDPLTRSCMETFAQIICAEPCSREYAVQRNAVLVLCMSLPWTSAAAYSRDHEEATVGLVTTESLRLRSVLQWPWKRSRS